MTLRAPSPPSPLKQGSGIRWFFSYELRGKTVTKSSELSSCYLSLCHLRQCRTPILNRRVEWAENRSLLLSDHTSLVWSTQADSRHMTERRSYKPNEWPNSMPRKAGNQKLEKLRLQVSQEDIGRNTTVMELAFPQPRRSIPPSSERSISLVVW